MEGYYLLIVDQEQNKASLFLFLKHPGEYPASFLAMVSLLD